jgi:hypothetical protein
MRSRSWLAGIVLTALCAMTPLDAAGQGRPNRPRSAPDGAAADGPVSPAEIQRLFDAYVAMQAQQQLELSDDQYARLLPRIKTLQDARRRHVMQRARLVQELRRLAAASPPDEGRISAGLKELTDLDERAGEEIRQAQDGVDQVLDVVQQARFRVFEEQMERRKVELLLRARQAGGRGGQR